MAKNGKILIVDDDQRLTDVIETVLRRFGYYILSAGNGKAALQMMAQDAEGFDLILTDIVMPIMNGYELAKAVKEKYPGVKVILMSGVCQAKSDSSKDSNIFDFLTKPFKLDKLKETVHQALAQEASPPLP